jgi:hypothetical protein
MSLTFTVTVFTLAAPVTSRSITVIVPEGEAARVANFTAIPSTVGAVTAHRKFEL